MLLPEKSVPCTNLIYICLKKEKKNNNPETEVEAEEDGQTFGKNEWIKTYIWQLFSMSSRWISVKTPANFKEVTVYL